MIPSTASAWGCSRSVEATLLTLFPGSVVSWLKRPESRGADVLDQFFGIDGELTTPQGLCFTVQSKVREHHYLERGDFTLEVFNDEARTEPGEWFNLTADLYFVGYGTPDRTALAAWYLFKVVDLKLAIATGAVRPAGLIPNRTHSRAWFTTVPWLLLPGVALLAKSPAPAVAEETS